LADNIPPSTGPQPNAEVAGVAAAIRLRLDYEFLARDLTEAERLLRDRMRRLSTTISRELNQGLAFDRGTLSLLDRISADRQRQLDDIRATSRLIQAQQQQIRGLLTAHQRISAEYRTQLALQNQIAAQAQRTAQQAPRVAQAVAAANRQAQAQQAQATGVPQAVAGFDRTAFSASQRAAQEEAQRIMALRTQVASLRVEQDRMTRSTVAGTTATTDESRAFAAAHTRADAFERQLRQLTQQTGRYNREAKQTSGQHPFLSWTGRIAAGSLIGTFVSGTLFRAISAVNQTIGGFISRTGDFTARMEQANVGLRQFVQTQQDAARLGQEAVRLAIATPFSIDQVLNATRRLLAMGTAVDEVIPRVRVLAAAVAAVGRGEGAGGNQEVFNRVILAISQIGAKSKLSMQDMRQLAEAGIPVFKILQEELGLTADQVQNIGRSGKSAAEGLEAIIKGLEKRFGAGLILQLNTLTGRFNNLNDIVDLVLGTLGKPVAPELTELLARFGDFLQSESTLRSAEAIGEAIAQILRDVQEWLLTDTSDFQAFLAGLPGVLQAIQGEAIKVKALFDNWTIDLNFEGRPIVNAGDAQAFIDEFTRLQEEFAAEAQRVAAENSEFRQIEMEATAIVRKVTADVARAQITVQGKEHVSTEIFNQIFDEDLDEAGLARELPTRAVEALNTLLQEVAQRTQGETGRSMAHIGAVLRQSLLNELVALGEAPAAAQVDEAIGRLRESLSIEGEFPLTDADRDILDLSEAVVRLSVEEGNLSRVQEELNTLTDRHKTLSQQETDAIDAKERSIRTLNDARKAESETNKQAIQDIRDRIDEEQRELREGDRGFEEQIRAEEANIKRLRGIFDPIIEQHRVVYEQASAELESLRERQQDVANSFASVTQAQERTIRDLQDARNLREEGYTRRIEEAQRAEKAHQRIIKDAQLDLRERIRLQDEEIERIEEKYRGELRIRDLAVEDQDRAIRQRRREFNLQDLEFAKAIADARARGDEGEVKRLREEREQRRIAFEESLEVARAELQVRQDEAEALRDQAEIEGRAAKQAKEDIQREGQRNLDNLERQGLALTDNRTAIEEERDTALDSFDRKIRIAQIFLELLNRTRQDVELQGKGQVQEAERAERAAKDALEAQEAAANGIIKGRETVLQGIRDNKAEFDRQQQDVLDQLNGQADALERQEAAAQRRHDAIVGPMEAELDTLRATHDTNERIRNQEIEKTRTQQEEIQKRITNYNGEIEKLGAIADLQDRIIANDAKRAEQERASATEGGAFTPENVEAQILAAIQKQPLFKQASLLSEIARFRSDLARTKVLDEATLTALTQELVTLLIKQGQASLAGEDEIRGFLTGKLPSSRQVKSIPVDVLELLAHIAAGDTERVAEMLSKGGETLAERIASALAGTETLEGSKLLAEKLPGALADLGALNDTLRTQLVALLQQFGVSIPEAGAAVGPTASEFATNKMENAADIQLEAARLMDTAAKAFSAATQGQIVERTSGVVQPFLQQSGDILAGAYLSTLLKGGANAATRASVLTDLKRIMDDPAIKASIVRSISEHPEEWRFLFMQLFGGRDASEVDMGAFGFFPPERDFVEQLDGLIATAEKKAGIIPEKMRAAMEREGARQADTEGFGWLDDASTKAGTDAPANAAKGLRDGHDLVRDGVNRGIVTPATEGFGALTTAAGTEAARVGPTVAEKMTSEESKAAVTQGVQDGVVNPAQAALAALAPLGSVAGIDLAAAAVEAAVTGLGEMASAETKAAVGKDVDELTGHIVATTRGGLSGEGTDIENAPMRGAGQEAAGALMAGMRDYLASAAAAQELLDALTPITSLAGINLRGLVTEQLAGAGAGMVPGGAGGDIVNPLSGQRRVTTAFGQSYSPFGTKQTHRGLDIAAQVGQSVYAIAAGTVSHVGWATDRMKERDPHGSYGIFIKIEHNVGGRKFSSIYAHLSKAFVKQGEAVRAGQAIGLVGLTGATTGPHLHLELRDAGGNPIDPLPLLPRPGGAGGSGLPMLPQGSTEEDVMGALQALAGGRLGAQGVTEAESALSLIVGAKSVVEAAGGDLMTVIDAVLSGATELTKEKLAGFSEFAASTMQQAFKAMRLAIEILGGGTAGEGAFRDLLEQTGLIPVDPVEELRALLAQAGPGGFGGALIEQLIKGSTQTVRELLATHLPTNALERLILQLIEEQFGLNIPLPKLAESLLSGGQLIAPQFPATLGRDPAAAEAAKAIREFALANRFLIDELGEQKQDPAITSLLKAIRDSEAKTLDELLKDPSISSILADDSPMGRFVALLRQISQKNPNLTMADLQGFLFGGPGFEAANVVDATNDVRDAVDTTNAILLGATDAESIQIWKALLTEWRETAPKIAEATALTAEEMAALVGEAEQTTANTGETAANTKPGTGLPGGVPGAPGAPGVPPRVETFAAKSLEELLQMWRDARLGEMFGVPVDPAASLQGAFTGVGEGARTLTEEQQALIDQLGASIKADDARSQIVSESERAIRDEMEARRALIAVLTGNPPPAPGAPSEPTVPVGTAPGGSGPRVQNTTFNISTNDPREVIAEVQARQAWGWRKYAE
jgi:tape measure domain-containing protein